MSANTLGHIVYIANARMPTEKAHGIQIAKMCEAFIEQGISLELVVPSRGTDSRSIREFYDLRRDVPMTRLGVPDWYGGRIGFVASSLVFAIRYFLHLYLRRMRGESFIIYTTDLDQFSLFLIPFLRVPYAVEMHDAKQYVWPFPGFLRRAACIIAVNSIIQRELADVFSLPPERIAVWPNGYDAHFFAEQELPAVTRRALGIPEAGKVALYVGKVYAWKGLDTFVAAARDLPGVWFYFVGGTVEELRAIGAVEGKEPSNLICMGNRTLKEVSRWMRAADVLVVSGTARDVYSYQHTSPMKLFEYLASGRPIVASRTPAIEAAVSDREVFFCAPDSGADMARVIQYALDHPREASEKTVRAARYTVSWEGRARGIRDFILMHL